LIANQEAYERLSQQFRDLPAGLEEVAVNAPARQQPPLSTNRLWKWGVAGALVVIVTLWLLWVVVIQNGT
jgi:ferric-dicitrate binding protein FerR (iron transport regulator)